MQKKKTVIALSLTGLIVLSGAAIALADNLTPLSANQATEKVLSAVDQSLPSQSPTPGANPNPYGSNGAGGYGMMGGYNGSNGAGGYGMMGGYNGSNGAGGYGMMGGYNGSNGAGGYGMMGGRYNASSLGVNLTNGLIENDEQAIAIAKAYVEKTNIDLTLDKLVEYPNIYVVKLKDAQSGENAYEFTISKNGLIYPQMGPKMMYNSEYGHMNWGNNATPTIDADQASKIALEYINQLGEGYTIGGVETASGYYVFIVQKDGKDYVELSVNAFNSQVWMENGNGPIINSIEIQ